MLVYVSEIRPNLLDDICDKIYYSMPMNIKETSLKKLIISNTVNFSAVKILAVDLSAIKDTTSEIIEALTSFQAMYKETRIIIIADKEQPNSPIFTRLLEIGVYNRPLAKSK